MLVYLGQGDIPDSHIQETECRVCRIQAVAGAGKNGSSEAPTFDGSGHWMPRASHCSAEQNFAALVACDEPQATVVLRTGAL